MAKGRICVRLVIWLFDCGCFFYIDEMVADEDVRLNNYYSLKLSGSAARPTRCQAGRITYAMSSKDDKDGD